MLQQLVIGLHYWSSREVSAHNVRIVHHHLVVCCNRNLLLRYVIFISRYVNFISSINSEVNSYKAKK